MGGRILRCETSKGNGDVTVNECSVLGCYVTWMHAMACRPFNQWIGPYVDGELPAADREGLEDHLKSCAACRQELARQRDLASKLSVRAAVTLPDALWPAIERRLAKTDAPPGRRCVRPVRMRRTPLALAAALVMAVGLGLFGAAWSETRAQASPLNFGVLLDALPLDAPKAFRKFLVYYSARELAPVNAKIFAPELNFELPETLPGGFRLDTVYGMHFGSEPGIAARYLRNGEFMAAIFHRPVQQEDFGTHRDRPCVIGQHRGHKVQVGEWKLVHLTDPTTCHCVLSRLDEETELPEVLAAVAPDSSPSAAHQHTHRAD